MMADRGVFVYENMAYPCAEPSDNPDPVGAGEEDLHFGANPLLEALRLRYGTSFMMTVWPSVAKHYGVDKDELLELWTRHYGPGFVLKETGSIATALVMFPRPPEQPHTAAGELPGEKP